MLARGNELITKPNSPPPADNYRGAHSEALYDTRWRIQIAVYIDDLQVGSGPESAPPSSASPSMK